MNRAHDYVIHCDYVTVVHVTSVFKCVCCETCIFTQLSILFRQIEGYSDLYTLLVILELYMNCLYVVMNGNREWARSG
jgi:hypothetical protein